MRKLATAAAVSLALASSGAFGLGLGDIEMRSALNQPMNAEIRLTAVKPGELDGMIVQLASADAFARAGLERSTALTDLRFSVDQSGAVPVIRIESQRPIVEPFLNFLLEVDWPQGRMVREYTVLLDPPVFMTPSATERNTTSDQPALVQRGDEALVVPTPIERNADSAADASAGVEVELIDLNNQVGDSGEIVSLDDLDTGLTAGNGEVISLGDSEIVSLTDLEAPNTAAIEQRERDARLAFDLNDIEVELVGSNVEVGDNIVVDSQTGALTPSDSGPSADGSTIVSLSDLDAPAQAPNAEVAVNRGDTLFEIAQSNSRSGVSVQQMMMALLAANESAFINNNINLVKAGATLRVPDADEASRLTQTQALAAIGQQNQLWQEYRDQLRGNAATQLAESPSSTNAADSGSAATVETPAADTAQESTAIDTASLDEEATDGLSAEARAILDSARNEILNREELKIVADNAPSSTTASATADETSDNDAQRLGELNRKLQLAREELSSTRLQSEDLSDQVGELQSTTDNLDALVALRQNEVAQLEAQLANARKTAEEAAAAGNASLDSIGDAATDTMAAAGDAVGDATDSASDLVADATSVMSNASDDLGDAAGEVVESGTNALTEAGETLAEVELVDESESESAADDAGIAPPVKQTSWYQDFLNDPKRMMIAGIGAIGLLGVLGTLLFRRKRRDDDDSLLEFDDEVEFIDDGEAAELQAEMASQTQQVGTETGGFNATGAVAGAAAAGAAAVGGVMAAGKDDKDDTGSLTGAFDEMADSSLELGSETQAVADATADDALDKDDTISEVDVYLAYGLHGQAEELLTKAIERKPNQPEYAQKLLQTYHAQGNSEGFHQTAQEFHARFGGESNPEWIGIASMGAELRPGDPLYASAGSAVQAIGTGDSDGYKFGDDDFLPASDNDEGSVSRGFGDSDAIDLPEENDLAAPELAASTDDESALMDESLDPAFAFDEADLEATGDFSQITDELAAETDGSIDFPGFDSTAAADSMDDTQADVDADDTGISIDDSLNVGNDPLGEALTMDELDGVVGSADDLTLDLDQLSGDLELDTAELLNSDLSDLEIPDLTAENEPLVDGAAAAGASADEMDTMLDLAKAYIDMGDKDSASSALDEIVKSGSPEQVNEAETLLRNIS